MKPTIYLVVLSLTILFLSACDSANVPLPLNDSRHSDSCQPGLVDLVGYTDKGKRLTNCFVEYPSEPTRQDKSYYIVEDICGQFTGDFISRVLSKKIIKTSSTQTSEGYNCNYYLDDTHYIMLILNYLKIENQKIGHESMGRQIVTNPTIPMSNYVVYQPDGIINSIYFILGDEKFISLQRNINFTNDELITFATNIAKEIKNYK